MSWVRQRIQADMALQGMDIHHALYPYHELMGAYAVPELDTILTRGEPTRDAIYMGLHQDFEYVLWEGGVYDDDFFQ